MFEWLAEFHTGLVRVLGAESLTITEHTAILENIAAGDVEGAAAAMTAHLTRANALYRRGWRKEDLVAGTLLVIDGYQARNGSKTANATSITFENGKRLFAGSSSQNSATK